MGEDRVEVIGASEGARAGLKSIGLFAEVIAYRTRLFIPAGERGAAILAGVFERHALLRCVAASAHA